MSDWRDRIRTPEAKGRLRGWFFWGLLAVSVVTVTATRGHDSAWPMIGWTMYWRIGDTPDVVKTFRVDVWTLEGDRLSFFPSDLLTHVERPLVENVMRQAFDSTRAPGESRRFLIRLLESRLAEGSIDVVTVYRLEWDVPQPPRLRHIRRDEPDRAVALGSFAAEDYP